MPEDVVWGNFGMNVYEGWGKLVVSYAAMAGLILFLVNLVASTTANMMLNYLFVAL